MPESVKISELPPLSSVQPNDIVPVVDEFLTQTSRATASQIAAIGGGPPGANTVSTDKIQDNAVTAAKCAFTGPDKLFSRIAPGAGSGVEIDCSPFARGLLAAQNGASARDYLDALQSTNNPVFTGVVKIAPGEVGAPSLTTERSPDVGLFFPTSDAMGFAAGNREILRIDSDGYVYQNVFLPPTGTDASGDPIYPSPILLPSFGARAFVSFNASSAVGASWHIGPSSGQVGSFFGLNLSIWDTAESRAYMTQLANAMGLDLTFPGLLGPTAEYPNFNDRFGRGNPHPRYRLGTESRANYTSPSDDRHWYAVSNGAGGYTWQLTPRNVTGKYWIGYIKLTVQTNTNPILQSAGITSVRRSTSTGAGSSQFRVTLARPMPDANYCVVGTCSGNAYVRLVPTNPAPTTTAFDVELFSDSGTAVTTPSIVNLVVFR